MQPPVHPELVLDNRLYTLARYAGWRRGGDAAQEEPGTPARGHLADGEFVYYKDQLATQVNRGQVHLTEKSDTTLSSWNFSRGVICVFTVIRAIQLANVIKAVEELR